VLHSELQALEQHQNEREHPQHPLTDVAPSPSFPTAPSSPVPGHTPINSPLPPGAAPIADLHEVKLDQPSQSHEQKLSPLPASKLTSSPPVPAPPPLPPLPASLHPLPPLPPLPPSPPTQSAIEIKAENEVDAVQSRRSSTAPAHAAPKHPGPTPRHQTVFVNSPLFCDAPPAPSTLRTVTQPSPNFTLIHVQSRSSEQISTNCRTLLSFAIRARASNPDRCRLVLCACDSSR
jgi:hypothetical protein